MWDYSNPHYGTPQCMRRREVGMLRRAMDVVELVALRGEISLREIGAAMRLPRSTTHRLVTHLVDVRLLESHRGAGGDVFAVGPLIKELGGGQLFWRPIVQFARPELTAARDETGETVGLHVLYAERRVLVDQVVSNHELRWVYGNHMVPMPLYGGAAAKMLLSMLPEDDMLRLAKHGLRSAAAKASARGPRALQELVSDIQEVRSRCYSLSSEEVNRGINSIAVPVVRDAGMLPMTVISLAAPTARMSDKMMGRHLKRLLAAARAIAGRLNESVAEPA